VVSITNNSPPLSVHAKPVVIPVWFSSCPVGIFDRANSVGGLTFDINQPIDAEVQRIADTLAKRLEEDRKLDAAADTEAQPANEN
jgi:hypothetical protein